MSPWKGTQLFYQILEPLTIGYFKKIFRGEKTDQLLILESGYRENMV